MRHTVRGYEANPALQEELMQEVLLAIWRSLERLRTQDSLLPFVLRIAHNLGASHVRDAVRLPRRLSLEEAAPEEAAADPAEEERRWLLAAVRRLPLSSHVQMVASSPPLIRNSLLNASRSTGPRCPGPGSDA